MVRSCQLPSLTAAAEYTPVELPTSRPILPVLLSVPHWMSLPSPALSLPMMDGLLQPIVVPVCAVLNHTDSELVPVSAAVSPAGTETTAPLPSKFSAVPAVPLWPVIQVGAVPPPAVLRLVSVPV